MRNSTAPAALVDDDPPSTRRSLLGRLAALPIAAAAAATVGVACAPAESATEELLDVDPEPMLFKIGSDFWEVDPVDRTCRWRDRREVLADDPVPQPEPIGAEHASASVFYIWRPEDAPHCRLCSECNAQPVRAEMPMAKRHPEYNGMTFCVCLNDSAKARLAAIAERGLT